VTNRVNLLSILILAIGAGWIFISTTNPETYNGLGVAAPQAGFLAPDFTLQTPDGESLTLSDFRGQPVLVNLWASWCGPCRAEMPAMERVFQEYKDQGVAILAVNATNQDSVNAAVSFADQNGLTFPLLMDVDGSVSRSYELRALPSSFFIDRDGVIHEVVIGGPMAEALLRSRIQSLLAEN
jgi:peroxiredoxin